MGELGSGPALEDLSLHPIILREPWLVGGEWGQMSWEKRFLLLGACENWR